MVSLLLESNKLILKILEQTKDNLNSQSDCFYQSLKITCPEKNVQTVTKFNSWFFLNKVIAVNFFLM